MFLMLSVPAIKGVLYFGKKREREPCLKMYFARNSVLIRLPWSVFLGGCHSEVVGWQPCVQHSQNKVFSLNLQCNRKLRLNLLMPLEGGANIHMYAIILRIL